MRHRLLIAIMLILPLCQGVLGKAKGEIAPASFAAGTDSSGAPAGQLGGNNALEWINRINLSGTLQGEARWMKYPGASYPESKSTSDLYLRIFELGIETNFLDWASGIAVLNSEWIGDYLNMGDEKLTVDEVHGDLRRDSLPFYLVFGKRTQPFGVFENHLVTDPMTQDAYETKKVGATVGVTGGMGLDVSVTLYKGDEQMGHLFQSGLFDTTVIIRNADPVRNVESYIGAVSLAPVNQLITMFGA